MVVIEDNIKKRINKIHDLIMTNEIVLACNALMDFVDEYSIDGKRKQEAVLIKSTCTELREDQRLYGKTDKIAIRFTKLKQQILEFTEIISDEHKKQSLKTPSTDENSDNDIGITPRNKEINDGEVSISTSNETKHTEQSKEKIIKSDQDNEVVFYANNVEKAYKSKSINFTLSPISLKLRTGEITAIVGENGSGKSTLLNIIARNISKSNGECGYPYILKHGKNGSSIKQHIGYISQETVRWYGLLKNNLHFSASIHDIKGDQNNIEVEFVVSRLGLDKYKYAYWNEISGGYKTRFSLAKVLIWHPNLLILDEPLANLDVNTQLLFLQDLRSLSSSTAHPMSVIISSQHLHEVESVADKIIFMRDGKALYNGKTNFFGNDRDENIFEISCNITKERLMDILEEKIEYRKIDQAGFNYIIYASISVTESKILKQLLENNVAITYFRDISKSTRKLFKVQS